MRRLSIREHRPAKVSTALGKPDGSNPINGPVVTPAHAPMDSFGLAL